MDIEERLPYSAIVDRPKLTWPNGARVALWIVPNVEHYEYLPRRTKPRNPWPRTPHPDVLGYSLRDYGNRVGLWRMLDVLDRYEMPCSVSLNISVFERYPEIMAASEARKWDVLCHGMYNTEYLWGMSPDEERALIGECCETFRRLTGRSIPGWFSPAATFTHNTPDLVAEAGIKYYSDFYHDDQPTLLNTKHGALVSVPYQMDINDAMVYRHHIEADQFARMIVDHFDRLYAEGGDNGRVVCIALHPYIMGQPHRIKALDKALKYIAGHSDVWKATGLEIAEWYRGQVAARGTP